MESLPLNKVTSEQRRECLADTQELSHNLTDLQKKIQEIQSDSSSAMLGTKSTYYKLKIQDQMMDSKMNGLEKQIEKRIDQKEKEQAKKDAMYSIAEEEN